MVNEVTNVLVCGLGGQGVIRASDIIADAAFRAGYDVKKSEIHGMSQRGGSVSSDVRFGPKVLSPMIPRGEAHYLVLCELSQREVFWEYLRPGGVLIAPQDASAEQLPHQKTLNVALLGVLSIYLDIPEDLWEASIAASFPPKLVEMNLQAFHVGRKHALSAKGSPSSIS